MANLDFKDMQGFLLSSYAKNMPCANYILLEVTDAAKAKKWLSEIKGYITSGEDRKTDFCLNIAFTAEGFKKIGFTEDKLGTFSVAFQEGMATPTRQQILGDYGDSEPKKWTWGGLDNPLDILLLLFTKNETELESRVQWIKDGIDKNGGIKTILNLAAGRQPDTREHFGFLDGVGQPVMEGTGQKERQLNRTGHATVVKAGEFVLGYENEMQKIDPLPESNRMLDFGRNGTYLVFRQLEQHVSTFWKYLRDTTANAAGEADQAAQEKLAAKMIGRWRSGAPITTFPHADPSSTSEVNEENNFGYAANDLAGTGCPIGAHIRRTNPRDSLFENTDASLLTVKRHRIMRRGRSYGDRSENVYQDDDIKRGLHFICLNSNIERQFEFIQQSWVNNPNFDNLNHETDPLIGSRMDHNVFSIQGCPVRTRVHQLDNFVTTKGGAYFFMPGMTALAHLSED